MPRKLGQTKISPISSIALMNGKFHQPEPKATKKPKSPAEGSTPTNSPAKQWNAAKFPAFISSAKSWTSPDNSADSISSGLGLQEPLQAAQSEARKNILKRLCRAESISSPPGNLASPSPSAFLGMITATSFDTTLSFPLASTAVTT